MKPPKRSYSYTLSRSQISDSDVARFLNLVPHRPDDPSKCWECVGSMCKKYSEIKIGGKMQRAHRVAMAIHCGEVPAGMVVHHVCYNTRCVRPSHLEICTPKQNLVDASLKGRLAGRTAGERHGYAKLNNEKVLEIRKRHLNGEKQAHLGREFGVTKTNIADIVHRNTWTHI